MIVRDFAVVAWILFLLGIIGCQSRSAQDKEPAAEAPSKATKDGRPPGDKLAGNEPSEKKSGSPTPDKSVDKGPSGKGAEPPSSPWSIGQVNFGEKVSADPSIRIGGPTGNPLTILGSGLVKNWTPITVDFQIKALRGDPKACDQIFEKRKMIASAIPTSGGNFPQQGFNASRDSFVSPGEDDRKAIDDTHRMVDMGAFRLVDRAKNSYRAIWCLKPVSIKWIVFGEGGELVSMGWAPDEEKHWSYTIRTNPWGKEKFGTFAGLLEVGHSAQMSVIFEVPENTDRSALALAFENETLLPIAPKK
jgi:hypothetical protein